MDIISDKKQTIFRKDYENKKYYSIGLVKKKQDGNYENGYTQVVFNKDVELENKTQIMIKNAWLDFYNTKDDKGKTITHTFIRINDFEIVGYIQDKAKEEPKEEVTPHNIDKWESAKNIEIDDDNLPFY